LQDFIAINTKQAKFKTMKVITSLCLLCIGLASASPAQSVFQAYLSTPPSGARLDPGRFWFQVNQDEVEFYAVVFQTFGQTPPSMAPVLEVPGSSLGFSLGDGAAREFRGIYSIADRNPFVPLELPFQYDDEGNPYLIDTPSIRYGWLYSGQFDLPAGFEAELLAGRGTVELNPFLSGAVAAVPEPAILTLGMMGAVGLLMARRQRNHSKTSVPPTFP
jgi:hypothetical protein